MRKKFGVLAVVCICLVLHYTFLDTLLINQIISRRLPTFTRNLNNENTDKSPFDECPLRIRDPWEQEIKEHVKLNYNSFLERKKNFTEITYLVNATVFMKNKFRNTHECSARCVNRKSDTENSYGEWIQVHRYYGASGFKCDIVEAECRYEGHTVYGMLHAQIVPNPKKFKNEFLYGKQYNVHILVLDSTSTTQAYRNMPNTMSFLENSMDAISFPFINKVGENSKPNVIALYFGKIMKKMDNLVYGINDIEPDINDFDLCKTYYDENMTVLMKEFTDRGYMSMMAEDWGMGALNWPGCNGLRTQPTDHYMRPYQLEFDYSKGPIKSTMKPDPCFLHHKPIFKYFSDFLTTYKGMLTFSWIWLTVISHDSENGSRMADTDILQLLLDHRETFDDSFFIILGDHGYRFGQVTKTPLGKLEVNNPLFIMSLPKELRSNKELMDKLHYNSRFLQTQFDIRATLLDILKYQPQSNFQSRERLIMDEEYGESFMREQRTPRNCKTLPIPSTFCICHYERKFLDTNISIATTMAEQVLTTIMLKLARNKVDHLCKKLEFKETTELETFVDGRGIYFISFTTTASAFAHFRAVVNMPSDNSTPIVVGAIDRIDKYGKKGDCIKEDKRLCVCKNETQPAKKRKLLSAESFMQTIYNLFG